MGYELQEGRCLTICRHRWCDDHGPVRYIHQHGARMFDCASLLLDCMTRSLLLGIFSDGTVVSQHVQVADLKARITPTSPLPTPKKKCKLMVGLFQASLLYSKF